MILRNLAIRHGRKALAAPLRRSCLRSLSTEVEKLESSIKNHETETGSIEANLNQLHLTKNFIPPLVGTKKYDDNVAQDYKMMKSIKKNTAKLGSVIAPHYEPHRVLVNPPSPKDITLELLMASQAHLGHATNLWNPANQRYIYGIRQGIHIISLETTAAYLRRAAKVVEGVAYHGGLILFVGTRPGQDESVIQAAEMAKGCHLFERWTPGSITNGNQILPVSSVKALDEHDNVVEGFDHRLEKWRALKPDLVVCLNPLENYVLLHECGLNNIPTIGIIDTDADPTWVTYPIPANDDSLRCTQLISAVLGRAGEEGQRKRLEAAKKGKITWNPTPRLGRPVTLADIQKEEELKRRRDEEDLMKTEEMRDHESESEVVSFVDKEDPLKLIEPYEDEVEGEDEIFHFGGEMQPYIVNAEDVLEPETGNFRPNIKADEFERSEDMELAEHFKSAKWAQSLKDLEDDYNQDFFEEEDKVENAKVEEDGPEEKK
ncbi:37S ribosomal protein Mrp4 [Phlyctema vagabunda]|uniref:37S ribosomal protein Mrp4 n=1 Tax=Phlyctema vagabunda TaxID=108571 RepID=A0ABR4PSL9_9HELO